MDSALSSQRRSGHWITGWNPDDDRFWNETGKKIARRNLIVSIFTEHLAFSVWSIWSVLVLFMSPKIGFHFTVGEKFLLTSVPTAVGALLRVPYSFAVTRFGGRNWTIFTTSVLLVPTVLAFFFIRMPGTPLWVFLVIGALAGVGGGNFASSMTNISGFYPGHRQGRALGLNAGGGNLGVAVIQIVGLLVIALAGDLHPSYVCAVYLPFLVAGTLLAAWKMDNIDAIRGGPGARKEALRDPDNWWISFLYVGTFGSFIGYSFAFGLVLQTTFHATPLHAAEWTFLGPMLGSLSRPVGGVMSDKWGGGRVALWSFVLMLLATVGLLVASGQKSFLLFVTVFTVLFLLSGAGNGAVYKMIPAVYARKAEHAVARGAEAAEEFATARRVSGAVIGIAGALGALGGVGINMVFRTSYNHGSATGALVTFLIYYAVCALVTWLVYLRGRQTPGSVGKGSRGRQRGSVTDPAHGGVVTH